MNAHLPLKVASGKMRSLKWPLAEKCLSQSLKLKYRGKERCRSLTFFQTTWITIFWKAVTEFLPNDANNILPTPALNNHVVRITALLKSNADYSWTCIHTVQHRLQGQLGMSCQAHCEHSAVYCMSPIWWRHLKVTLRMDPHCKFLNAVCNEWEEYGHVANLLIHYEFMVHDTLLICVELYGA